LNREQVSLPDEPLLALPQDEFREPVREFAERARTEILSFSVLIIFGSVARGEADNIFILFRTVIVSMDTKNNHLGMTVDLSIPVTDPDLFSHRATAQILTLLADNPYTGFGIRELSRATDYTHRSISQAVADLEAADLVTAEQSGPQKLVRINRARLNKPEDPILAIPQTEFHEPVRDLVTELKAHLTEIRGIVLFGSVARGEADRQSDIDCFVLVGEKQAVGQQTAHKIVEELHESRYNGDRYTFQVLVESVETATQYGQRLQTIFAEGITLSTTETFQQLKQEVLTDG
jgi:predicted nucleotidyltransferase